MIDHKLILWVMIQYDHFLFCCSNCPSFGHWEIFQVSPVSFKQISSIHSFTTSLLSSTTRCSRLPLCFPCPSPRIHSKKSWFFFIGVWYLEAMIWVLGVLVTTGVSLLLHSLILQSQESMYVHWPTCIYTSTLFLYLCVCGSLPCCFFVTTSLTKETWFSLSTIYLFDQY